MELRTTNIKGKEYVQVNERIRVFRSLPEFKGYSMESNILEMTADHCIMEAIIRDENGNFVANGLAREDRNVGMVNKTSYVENCETSAWGRALGNLGIGVDSSIATAEEVENAITAQLDHPKAESGARRKRTVPSEKQLKFFKSLLAQTGKNPDEPSVKEWIEKADTTALTQQISVLKEKLGLE